MEKREAGLSRGYNNGPVVSTKVNHRPHYSDRDVEYSTCLKWPGLLFNIAFSSANIATTMILRYCVKLCKPSL